MRHVNIPIFIPHLGCPNQCVFCNQRTISGVQEFDSLQVRKIIDDALSTIEEDSEVEIAFFGGSFTGIDRSLMIELLKTAHEYISVGKVRSIRCSTRPDYIDDEVLSILKMYGVRDIELGLQSTSDEVLSLTKRGHGFAEESRACRLIIDNEFNLTGQMMIGLPGATADSEIATADFIISAGCKSARIYPTVVFKNTELCEMTARSVYTPLTLDDAVARSAAVLEKFVEAGVKVIRIGLCASENLASKDTYFAGPNHPALGELVENELYYRLIRRKTSEMIFPETAILRVFVSSGAISKAVGHKKRNKLLLMRELGIKDVRFEEDRRLSEYEISLRVEEGE